MNKLYEMPRYNDVGEFIRGHLVRVDLMGSGNDAFLTLKETLTRMGIAVYKGDIKKLYQTCHILHKRGDYFIVHFKELFILDGRENNLTNEDVARRNRIIDLLEDWNMIKVPESEYEKLEHPKISTAFVKVIPHHDKENWQLIPKYVIGGDHNEHH
ncbi:MAG: translational repressor RegA [Candidatus Peribacteraceae bacterium]|nr:translational repressor RegA [Candidatus Peribacteraceae bacterium]